VCAHYPKNLTFIYEYAILLDMEKINNKIIVFILGILVILAFSLVFMPLSFNEVSAAYGTNITYRTTDGNYSNEINNPIPSIDSINPKSSNVGIGTKTITITGSGFVPSSIARVNASNRPTTFIDDSHLLVQINGNDTYAYRTNGGFFITVFNGAPGGGYSDAAFFTVNNTATPPITSINNNNNFPDTFIDTVQTENGTVNDTGRNYSNLAANAIFGSNGFMPSGLIQWILLAIIILVIVILVRKISGAEEKYHSTPLKHA